MDPRRLSLLSLLALVPVAAFLLGREPVVWLSGVCVLLIAGSLYYAFGPTEAGADAAS